MSTLGLFPTRPGGCHPPDVEGDAKSDRYRHACNQLCDTPYKRARHDNSKKHLARVAKLDAGVHIKFRCDVCKKGFADIWTLRTHDKGQRHKAKVVELQEAVEDD